MASRLMTTRAAQAHPAAAVAYRATVSRAPTARLLTTLPSSYRTLATSRKSAAKVKNDTTEPSRESIMKPAFPSKKWDDFSSRHIGPRDSELGEMLSKVGAESMDSFISEVVPADVVSPPTKIIHGTAWSESRISKEFERWARQNNTKLSLKGGGYYNVTVPPVIKRNVLENPAWYTSYTPYQAEVSQGRLESLLNFQTMVSDMTGLPVANSSLLDEGTAASEAMTMSINSLSASRLKKADKTYVISHLVNPRTVDVMQGRAEGFGVKLVTMDLSEKASLDKVVELGDNLVGVMVQYPDIQGGVEDFSGLADLAHKQGVLMSAATDLSALTYLKAPGEWGADIAFGNSQRFGVPLGFGGPHAAFMAVKEANKRRLPGRIIGVSKDRLGQRALRLALQTREQHIRREKATSNVCTAQALLANMAAMYAIYHGPEMLRQQALWGVRYSRMMQKLAEANGYTVVSRTPDGPAQVLSDTITIRMGSSQSMDKLKESFAARDIECTFTDQEITMALPFEFSQGMLVNVALALKSGAPKASQNVNTQALAVKMWKESLTQNEGSCDILASIPQSIRRESSFLTHPVFNSHHSETEMLRYIHHLQSRDLSLVHSMIPLGSCTMKLNATKQMELIGNTSFSNVHPNTDIKNVKGYQKLIAALGKQLIALTGMDDISLQPNSGAQGEFAGLRAIRKWHEQQPGSKRDICFIPASAHGTNPASAAMAGMRVLPIKCDTVTGNLDLADLKTKCEKHADELGAIMITYPSTYGVFEPDVRKVCDMVHEYGGLVYMDGANMNAQIGITSPGVLGADVCHLNLHKTFCIPHGGGGPGVGPICIKEHLSPYLPGANGGPNVASADFGSASILPISWAYIAGMGDYGLRKATEAALLNANYLLARLKDHYSVVYTNDKGRCAHEFIIDIRPFTKTAGIENSDISKRLQDYGFHSPTMSFPVAGTLMIEPTESESKQELDRFVDALVNIRNEIREIEEGKQPREGNVLKMAPHPQMDIVMGDGEGKWDRPYSREKAAYPLPYLKEKKFWPVTARVDDAYGDTNLFCTCPPVEDTTGEA